MPPIDDLHPAARIVLRRRELILGIAAAAWPVAGRTQQTAIPLVGFLHSASASPNLYLVEAVRRGLADAGYTDGLNVSVEYRWADGHYDRLAELAADLVRRSPAAILCGSPTAAQAAKAATTSIPLVFVSGTDPIKAGLVDKLNRPGGNITGIFPFSAAELGEKHVELLHELEPAATVVGLLVNPANSTESEAQTHLTEAATNRLGLSLTVATASTQDEFENAFAALIQQHASALIVGADPFFTSQRDQLVALAARHTLPTIYNRDLFVAAGGLMSYGTDFSDAYRQAAIYTGRILKGERPGDLPVQQATKFQLVINLKAARALGLTVPEILLAQADKVID
jgi:putative ABC transport system substrate-binding protein